MFDGREARSQPSPEAVSRMVCGGAAAHRPSRCSTRGSAATSLRGKFLAQMRKYPILLCPAAAIPAFRHGERSWTIDGKTVNYLDAWSYTEWFNLLGNPAAVVPVSHSAEGSADRRADRRPAVGRRTGAGRRGRAGEGMQCVENPADRLNVTPAFVVFLYYSACRPHCITLSARDFGHCGADLVWEPSNARCTCGKCQHLGDSPVGPCRGSCFF